jgi:hypothetical protein
MILVRNADRETMHELCTPLLYKEIITNDFGTFASELETNHNIKKTTRLHLYHKWHWWEPTYEQIFDNRWDEFECKTEPESIIKTQSFFTKWEECDTLIEMGVKIRRLVTSGVTVLPQLRVVSIGGIGEQTYSGDTAWAIENELVRRCGRSRILAHTLLDLPTVQHYCQGVCYGPLALPNRLLISKSALKTFTIHHRGRPLFCICLMNCDHTHQPPIILGAVNRYFCKALAYIPLPIQPESEAKWLRFLLPIFTMLCRPAISLADPATGETVPFEGEITAELIKGTQVEIYDFVRTHLCDKSLRKKIKKDVGIVKTLPPQSLSWFQDKLDEMLAKCTEGWVGRVKLLNREEAPLCPACGFDSEESHEDYLRTRETGPNAAAGKGKMIFM